MDESEDAKNIEIGAVVSVWWYRFKNHFVLFKLLLTKYDCTISIPF